MYTPQLKPIIPANDGEERTLAYITGMADPENMIGLDLEIVADWLRLIAHRVAADPDSPMDASALSYTANYLDAHGCYVDNVMSMLAEAPDVPDSVWHNCYREYLADFTVNPD